MADDSMRFYVWVFVPSAVRRGYQWGAYRASDNWRFEYNVDAYIEETAVHVLWKEVSAVAPEPTFYSADAIDAPLSAALCAGLNAKVERSA